MNILPMPHRPAQTRGPVRAGAALRVAGAVCLALGSALALAADAAPDSAVPEGTGNFQITRHAIAGGGADRARSACFDLAGTIGQPVAGVSSGGDFTMTAGFWPAVRLDDSILRTSFEDCDP